DKELEVLLCRAQGLPVKRQTPLRRLEIITEQADNPTKINLSRGLGLVFRPDPGNEFDIAHYRRHSFASTIQSRKASPVLAFHLKEIDHCLGDQRPGYLSGQS